METYCIVRVFRDDKKGYIPNMVKRIRDILSKGINHVVVVVSDPLDKEGTDIEISANFSKEKVSVLRLRSYRDTDYWSVALNEGIHFIAAKFGIFPRDKLLICSNEVTFSSSVLEKMSTFLNFGIGGVGVRFKGFEELSYQGIRNTFALWDLVQVLRLGLFSLECDVLGGMEDYYMSRLMASKGIGCMTIESNDVSLVVASVTNQKEKELREIEAMEKIDRLLRERFNI